MRHFNKMRAVSLLLALAVVVCEWGGVIIPQTAVVHAAELDEDMDSSGGQESEEDVPGLGDSEESDEAKDSDSEASEGGQTEEPGIANGEQETVPEPDMSLAPEEMPSESRALSEEGKISLRFEGTDYCRIPECDTMVEETGIILDSGQSFSFTIIPSRTWDKVGDVRIKETGGDAVLTKGEDEYHWTISPADPETGYTQDHVISISITAMYQLTLDEYNLQGVKETVVVNGDSVTSVDLTAEKPTVQGLSGQDTTVYVKTAASEDDRFVWRPWVSLECLNEDGSLRSETLSYVEDAASMSEEERAYAQKGYYVFRLGRVYAVESISLFRIGAYQRCRYRFTLEGFPEDVHIIGYVQNGYGAYVGQEVKDEILLTPGCDFYFQLKWEGTGSADYKWCTWYPVIVDNGNGASQPSFDSTTLEGVEGTVWRHSVRMNTQISIKLVPHTIALEYNADDIVDMAVSSGNAKLSEDRRSLDVYGGDNLVLSFRTAEGLEPEGVSSDSGDLGLSHDYGGTYWASVENMSALPEIRTIRFAVRDTMGRISLSDPANNCSVMCYFEGRDKTSPFYTGGFIEARSLKVTIDEPAADGRKPRRLTLMQGRDYTVSYQDNKDAGEALLIVSAMPDTNYRGTFLYPFTIKKEQTPAFEDAQQQVEFADWGKELQINLPDLFVFDGKYDKNVKPVQYRVAACDLGGTLSTEPVLEGERLTYAVRRDAASGAEPARITLLASFTNYEDAEVTLTIQPVKKDEIVLGGRAAVEDKVYDGQSILPDIRELKVISRDGTALSEQDAAAILDQIRNTLSYRYTGIDGTQYDAEKAPVDIGSYRVQVRISDENQAFRSDYLDAGTFRITGRPLMITVDDVALYLDDSVPAQYGYQEKGLAQGDTILSNAFITCGIKNTKETGEYPINVDAAAVRISSAEGRDVTANYLITGVAGMLRVCEPEPGSYTLLYDLSGKGENVRRSGIAAGSLLIKPLDPVAAGYVFLGWYRDQALSKEWDFDTDTIQEDMVLYAGWSRMVEEEGLTLCVQEIPPQVYTGKALKPTVTVYAADGKTRLKPNQDYQVAYRNNTDADAKRFPAGGIPAGGMGAASDDTEHGFDSRLAYAVITGKGNYTGAVYVNFHIEQANIGAGEELSPGIAMKCTDQFEEKTGRTAVIVNRLKYKNLTLRYNTDYTLAVVKEDTEGGWSVPVNLTDQGQIPLNAGAYSLTIAGKGNYGGSVTRKLYIAPKTRLLKNAKVKCKGMIVNVTKQQLADGVNAEDLTVSMGGETLEPGTDYTVAYVNHHAVGTATVTVTGIGNYVGSKSCTYKIKGIGFKEKALQPVGLQDMVYTGAALTQNDVRLKGADGSELIYGTDYTIVYKNNIKTGKATMIFTAKPASGYSGSFKKTFKINALSLASENIVLEGVEKREQGYVLADKVPYRKGGAAAADRITVRLGAAGALLREGRDYTVSYVNHMAISDDAAQMILKGKGNYTGSVTVHFGIAKASLAQLYEENKVTITPKEMKLTYSFNRYREDPESDWEYELKDPEYEFKPGIVIKDGKKILENGVDYEVAYFDNTRSDLVENGSAAYAEIKGLNHYAGPEDGEDEAVTIPLSIYRNKLSASNLYIVYQDESDLTYTGEQIRPEVSVYYGKPADISKAKRNKITDEDILTEEKPERDPDSEEQPEYAYGLVKLQEYQDGTGDYFLSYGANVAKGKKGKVIVQGTGSYAGRVMDSFTIAPRQIYTKAQQPSEDE